MITKHPLFAFQIHSLTARSVPRQFREGLKKGMPFRADTNIKVPTEAKVNTTESENDPVSLNIVYDSEQNHLVPYPDGEFIRTPSPEHSGIPARPAVIPVKMMNKEVEYTSDDDSVHASEKLRKLPPSLRRKAKNGTKF